MTDSTLTSKYQATVPKQVREFLGLKAGQTISWHVVKASVIVDAPKKIKNPTRALTGMGIHLNVDAVKLVREVRENL
ncbi:MAG: AbrB/MazE/SpoVT family DNA-binding domain-containing protein [Candidatus Diapherotrites archaeon]|nr:AbrB/MazE/SpoVT family DNA-binding domain-containing protein [Candidatus Diapherotrites archaeon]